MLSLSSQTIGIIQYGWKTETIMLNEQRKRHKSLYILPFYFYKVSGVKNYLKIKVDKWLPKIERKRKIGN